MQHDRLENWEKWPLGALFLANALNIFLLYVPISEMPLIVVGGLPWIRVGCGVAAAASLEGTLIAVTMGRRLGRNSYWSWATMLAASVFTAAVAYYVHFEAGIGAASLFMAQAIVLFIYSQHLAEPRKSLHAENHLKQTASSDTTAENPIVVVMPHTNGTHIDGVKCRSCGEVFDSAQAVKAHRLEDCPGRLASTN